ncbi:aspartic peptidase domain-containing protein [Multifurca ochricompacta]|uniref:Aspartic peptidase domain-containing protein n=1 Tax=Multifurca ochricompacta TaxID=376703 RepID=A0AAD4M3I7_9AGAM|nr:aspartic peptidase domain-containing protein [Multifurca ochricompacta]
MLLPLLHLPLLVNPPWSWATPLSLPAIQPGSALHLPLTRQGAHSIRRRVPKLGSIGLGDYYDVTYNVLVQIGETFTPLVLDTGSSDLWVLSSSCSADCFSVSVPLYHQTSFQPSGLAVRLAYGDSLTGTYAQGPVGKDVAGVAGLRLQDQYLAAISETNTSVLQTGSAGIFGLGFPVNRLLVSKTARDASLEAWNLPAFSTRIFPDLSEIRGQGSSATRDDWGRLLSPSVDDALASFATNGPLLTRLILAGALASPIVAISMQRDTVEIGGNQGMLSIGELPIGIAAGDLTWVPLRGYTVAEGGLPAPEDSPNESYIQGNSLIRGPKDVLESITGHLGGNTYDCSEAHTLAFQIGGNLYPLDPRDFGSQTFEDTTAYCTPNIAPTDPPGSGFLYSWSIGDPFFKSVFIAFYYGNLTHPSQDQPRVGFLSTVPSDAAQRLQVGVQLANTTLGGNLPMTYEAAPSSAPSFLGAGTAGVPQAHPSLPSEISPSTGAGPKRVPLFSVGITNLLTVVCATFALY